jgi:hypothetical protein
MNGSRKSLRWDTNENRKFIGMLEDWNDGMVSRQKESKGSRREVEASYAQYSIVPIFHFSSEVRR